MEELYLIVEDGFSFSCATPKTLISFYILIHCERGRDYRLENRVQKVIFIISYYRRYGLSKKSLLIYLIQFLLHELSIIFFKKSIAYTNS